ncbi:DUF4185 domain-containing protein [Paenibacillus arenilitoris]|uniref:DUF4185 domain-containing protein n=1 Tax=Paenibacillus arenilitoris TaxID=2772299 RepID=A0A927CFM2_9BACL|nr:DUF4185 domain-containing protein [Paenibacillus arenilitoris]MBD2867193.1 DUF4185 domain-containing protein [Paenibacillus arenilitoris]
MMRKLFAASFSILLLTGLAAVPAWAVTPENVTTVSRVTGKTQPADDFPNPNQTHSNYHVWGTDLGIMWDGGNGKIMIAFGDTDGSAAVPDWRSNTLAISTDTLPADGLAIDTMIQNPPGRAKQIIPSKKINNDEITVIPTAGITVGTRHYIHFMSVKHWGTDGNWLTNYAGIAYSDDDGLTWTKDANARWMNDATGSSRFQQAAFVKDGGYVYMYTTKNGRVGNIFLTRVPEADMLDKASYEYWSGNGWTLNDEAAAKPVAMGPAGEMSVAYNSHFDKWFMAYKNKARQALVIREADEPTGPWTGEKIVKRGAGLYGPFIHPWYNDGDELYFTMSRWRPEYNVFFMKADLVEDSLEGNLLSDPGFEDQLADEAAAPWYAAGSAVMERSLGLSYAGANNVLLSGTTGTHAIKQQVALEPNTTYTLKGRFHSSANNANGYLGARLTGGGAILNEKGFGALSSYTEQSVAFTTNDIAIVEIYAGMTAGGDEAWVRADDLTLTKGVDFAGLRQLTEAYAEQEGIATALKAKLSAAEGEQARGNALASNKLLNAYIHQVRAQLGKAIEPDDAGRLIQFAEQLKEQ